MQYEINIDEVVCVHCNKVCLVIVSSLTIDVNVQLTTLRTTFSSTLSSVYISYTYLD